MIAVLTGSMSALAEVLANHLAQERQRLDHFVHAVHSILDADPALVVVLGQDAKNRVVVVEAFTRDAVAEVRRVTKRTVTLPEVVQGRAFGQVSVAGMHADNAV